MSSKIDADDGGAEEEDLYGDLDSAPLAKMAKACPSSGGSSGAAAARSREGASSSSASFVPYEPLNLHGMGKMYDEAHVTELQRRIDALTVENANLKRNIGTLYRTARAELARKDEAILRLQDEVDGLRMAAVAGSSGDRGAAVADGADGAAAASFS